MSRFIGREIEVGVGIEATGEGRGTAVAPDFWFDKNDAAIFDRSEVSIDGQSIGRIEDALDASVVLSWAEGEFSGRVMDQSIGVLLYAALGEVDSDGTKSPYTHTFTVDNKSSAASVTIEVKDKNEQLAYALGVLDSLEISGAVGEPVEFTAAFQAKRGSAATNEPAYVADEKAFLGKHVSIAIGSESPVNAKEFSIKISRNAERAHILGNEAPADILNKQFSVDFSFTIDRNATAFANMYRDGDISEVVITMENDNKLDSGTPATCASLTITLPRVVFTDWSQTNSNDNIVTESFTGKALYDKDEEGYMIEAVLVNGHDEYVATT